MMAHPLIDCPPHRMRCHTPCPCRLPVAPASSAPSSSPGEGAAAIPRNLQPARGVIEGGNSRGCVAPATSYLAQVALAYFDPRALALPLFQLVMVLLRREGVFELTAGRRLATLPHGLCWRHEELMQYSRNSLSTTSPAAAASWWRTSDGDSQRDSWVSTSGGQVA